MTLLAKCLEARMTKTAGIFAKAKQFIGKARGTVTEHTGPGSLVQKVKDKINEHSELIQTTKGKAREFGDTAGEALKENPHVQRFAEGTLATYLLGKIAINPNKVLSPEDHAKAVSRVEDFLSRSSIKAEITPDAIGKLFDDNLADRPMLRKILGEKAIAKMREKAVNSDYGPFFGSVRGTDGVINMPEYANLGVGMHEAGHAINMSKMSPAVEKLYNLSRQLGPTYSTIGGMAMAKAAPEEYKRFAPIVSVLGGMPMVAEEAVASMRGFSNIAKERGTMKALKEMKDTIPAWGTYLNSAVITPYRMTTSTMKG